MATPPSGGKVLGEPVKVCIEGVMTVFQNRTRNMLNEEGIEEPDPKSGEWYPMEKFVRVLNVIERDAGENALRKIGEATPEFTDWPDGVTSPEGALQATTEVYSSVHENVPGGLTVEATGTDEVRVTSTTPYPTNWEKGFLKGTVEKFGSAFARVDHLEESSGEKVFEVRW